MSSSHWSTESPATTQKGTPLWMKVALGIAALPFVLGMLIYARVQDIKARTWPAILQVSRRLQTDTEARRLYQANPALARGYASEDAFLERVKEYRDQFAALPELPPKERGLYESFSSPMGFFASVKGSGQAWVAIEVSRSSLLRQTLGEGLMRLDFSTTKEPNGLERRALRKARLESDWKRYKEICAQLGTDEGTKALWAQEPGLKTAFPNEAALLRFAADTRVHLRAYPEPEAWSMVRLQHQERRTPFGDSMRFAYPFPKGTLIAVWSDGKLSSLQFEPQR